MPDGVVAVAVLALLTLINCLGVRAGSNVQSGLMVLKIVAIAVLVVVGWWLAPPAAAVAAPPAQQPIDDSLPRSARR